METKNSSAHSQCPLAAVDKRLEDAHRLWHQAEQSYFDPEAFRLAAQNTIQTLRTVSFVLQNHKRTIPDFDQWYGSQQEKMRANPLLRWIVEARNKIEKQGDLESHSLVRVETIASYLDNGPSIEIPFDLFSPSTPALLRESIPKTPLGDYIVKYGSLRIQRRWVENSLPDYELLDALAIAYGHMSELVHDAHRQMSLPPPSVINCDGTKEFTSPMLKGRMPCMIGHHDPRSLIISLKDGKILEFERRGMISDTKIAEIASERYEIGPDNFKKNVANIEELAAMYFQIARTLFLKDGYHIDTLLFIRDIKVISMCEIRMDNSRQNYHIMRKMADEATRIGADAAIRINEIWAAPANELSQYQRPAEYVGRKEGLALFLVGKTGHPIHFYADITRKEGKASLGDTVIHHGGAPFIFAPFYQAWGRTIPTEWETLEETMEGLNKQS